jgi:hypothetical protein
LADRPNIIIRNKKERICTPMFVLVPSDGNVT